MNDMSTGHESEQAPPPPASQNGDCPLSSPLQIRNVLLFSTNVGLIYLAAPVLYVGITQAALFDQLKTDKTVANLPVSIYFLTTPLIIIFAWYFSAVRLLRPVLVAGYLVSAAAGAMVVATLFLPGY